MKIPDEWTISTVGEGCVIRNDLRMPISIEERKKIEGTYPYYGPTGILGCINAFRVHGKYALIGEDGDHFLKYKTKSQTLLVNDKFNVNNHAHLIGDSKICLAEWFYAYFQHRNLEKYLTRQGAGRYKLTKQSLSDIPILLPPIEEQKAIAAVLLTWDGAIEKTEKLIRLKEDNFRRLGIKAFKNQRISRWNFVPLGELVKVKKGEQRNRSELDKKGMYPAWNGGITPSGYANIWNTQENTITISEGGNSCGFVNYCKQKFWCGGHCYSLINENNQINNDYLYFYLKTHEKQIMSLRVGSGLPNIQKSDIENFEIAYPNLEEQIEISHKFNTTLNEIILIKKRLDLYKSQKQGLMQKLLTGKWRVNFKEEK